MNDASNFPESEQPEAETTSAQAGIETTSAQAEGTAPYIWRNIKPCCR